MLLDTAGARSRILAKIRKAQSRGGQPSRAEREAVETYVRAHPRGVLPEVTGDLVAWFRAKAEATQSTTEEVGSQADVPAAVARYCDAYKLATNGCVWPALSSLDWKSAGLPLEPRAAHGEDKLGVTGVFAALAETGSLMVVSGPDSPASVSLLPETHVAVVPASRIVAHMEIAWAMAREAFGQLPRAVNFISGPSRTADIEQRMVLGAHGPYRVHVIVVRGA